MTLPASHRSSSEMQIFTGRHIACVRRKGLILYQARRRCFLIRLFLSYGMLQPTAPLFPTPGTACPTLLRGSQPLGGLRSGTLCTASSEGPCTYTISAPGSVQTRTHALVLMTSHAACAPGLLFENTQVPLTRLHVGKIEHWLYVNPFF